MKNIIKQWKQHDFDAVYTSLKEMQYEYSLKKFLYDFKKISSIDKYCYLIYLLSQEYTVKNVLLICDFLTYEDPFFTYIHPVIHMFLRQAVCTFPDSIELLRWIICTYENHPDSLFSKGEMELYKETLHRT